MQKEIPLPSTAAGGPPNAITELCVEEKATKCPNVEAAESQIEMTESTALINEEKAKNELAKRLHADATDPSNDYPVTVRLMSLEMARGIVDEAIETVTPEQSQEAISKAIPRAIVRVVLKFIDVMPSKVQEEVFKELDEEGFKELDEEGFKELDEEGFKELDEEVSGSLTKAEVAELVGVFTDQVFANEGGGIVAVFVSELAEHLVLEIGGHVTQEDAQRMVRDAIKKKFGKEVRQARTRVASAVTSKLTSELISQGTTQRQVEVVASVAVEEVLKLIIHVAEETISEIVMQLVADLVEIAAQKLPGLSAQDYQEILRVDCRRQGKSIRADFDDRCRLLERSSEPEKNVVEARSFIQAEFASMCESFSEFSLTFVVLGICAIFLRMFLLAVAGPA